MTEHIQTLGDLFGGSPIPGSKQLATQAPPLAAPMMWAGRLLAEHQHLRAPVVHGLLRRGETCNLIGAPKRGKSWTSNALALCIASKRDWFGHRVEQGRVLVTDFELHKEDLAHRIRTLAQAMNLSPQDYAYNVAVLPLRGVVEDIYSIARVFHPGVIPPGYFSAIILDALYKLLPLGTDENSNAQMAQLYRTLDCYAGVLDTSFFVVHHTSKGMQGDRSITDVGSGAGSISRSADCHVILRQHEEDDAIVFDATTRSWPPPESKCFRWNYPLWVPAPELDPSKLKGLARKRKSKDQILHPEWTLERFVQTFIGLGSTTKDAILASAVSKTTGLSERRALTLLRAAVEGGLVVEEIVAGNEPHRFRSV